MPKDVIDYSNTIIYKIYCKDNAVIDVYVGHTTNFAKRKYQHKASCNNLNNKLKIYTIIREKGGWDNWTMIEIAKYNCKDHTEARIKEQEHYDELKPSLNSCPPYVNLVKYHCNICNIKYSNQNDIDNHNNTKKHKNKLICIENNKVNITPDTSKLFTENSQKSLPKFVCKMCDYYTSKKTDYDKHILTLKHIKLHNLLTNVAINSQGDASKKHVCECGKKYSHRQSLFTHKKKCKLEQDIKPNNDSKDVLVEYLMKENTELKQMIIDVCKNVNVNNSFNTTNNSHNKTFNLNVFLNETCKDAMNIMDFVNSIQLQLSDLESVGKLGFIEGISNIITTNLKALDITQRPVHCTDNKRETIYVKDENKWEKEDDQKNKIRKAIKKIATKNMCLLPKFKEAHPDCNRSSSKYSDQYNKIVIEACGGRGDNDLEKEDKIIRNIAKLVTIDKKLNM